MGTPRICGEPHVYISTTFLVSIEVQLQIVPALCAHRNQHILFSWANANLCEIIQDLVDALSPLQTTSEGHEERFAALEAVQKTAKEQASGETQRTTEQTREFTESLFGNASQESGHQVPDSAERPRRINASVLGHDQPEWLAGVLGRLQTMEASIATLSEAADRRPAVPSQILLLKPREDVLLFSSPRDPLLQAWTALEFWVLRSMRDQMN